MTKKKRDACEFCLGAKGGTPGHENAINGVVACDYCTALLLKTKQTMFKPSNPLPSAQQAIAMLKSNKKGPLVKKKAPSLNDHLDQYEVVGVKDGF